jgi:predicted PurR-regulated permease PerM
LVSAASFFRRYWRIILFIAIMILVFWVLWKLLNIMLPFILGLILAYFLLPAIQWVEKKLPWKTRALQTKRILLIILIYILVLAAIGVTLFYTVPYLVNSFSQFITNLPQIISGLTKRFQDFFNSIRQSVPPQIQDQLNIYLANIGNSIFNALSSVVSAGFSYLSSTFGLVLGFASLPVFLFFLLKDAEKLNEGFYAPYTPWLREHIHGIVAIISNILGRYIRASVVLGLAVAILDFIGLVILGIPFAPALAFWAGLTELIPVLGPWIGGAAGVIVTLATDSSKTIWVLVLYFVVQFLEGNLLVPRIHSQYLKIHPAVILILLVIGGHFGGFWGIILIVPFAATFMQISRFLIRSIKEEGLRRE